MEPQFVDDENIPLVDFQDDNYDNNYDVSKNDWEDTSFSSTYETPRSASTYLSQEITRQKLDHILHKLDVNGDVDLNIDRFRTRLNPKTNAVVLEFDKSGRGDWVNLTNKRTGEPLNVTTIKNVFGGLSAMKSFLGLEETPPRLNRAEAKQLYDKTPTEIELKSMSNEKMFDSVDKITREIATNTSFDMREMMGLDQALQRLSGELKNNTSKLTEIDQHIEKERRKLEELQDTSYSDEQRKRVELRLDMLKEERKARLEVASQNRKDLSSQLARIRQTVEQILDKDLTLGEKVRLVFREQGITIAAVVTAIGLIIESIVTALSGGGGSSSSTSTPNNAKQWLQDKLKALARLLGRLAQKAAAALPGIIGAIFSALLNFLGKTVGFLAKHTWAVIVGIFSFICYETYRYTR